MMKGKCYGKYDSWNGKLSGKRKNWASKEWRGGYTKVKSDLLTDGRCCGKYWGTFVQIINGTEILSNVRTLLLKRLQLVERKDLPARRRKDGTIKVQTTNGSSCMRATPQKSEEPQLQRKKGAVTRRREGPEARRYEGGHNWVEKKSQVGFMARRCRGTGAKRRLALGRAYRSKNTAAWSIRGSDIWIHASH